MRIAHYLQLIRTKHWAKNLFIFFPIFFSGQLLHFEKLLNTLYSFIGFSLVASVVYIYNDYQDIETDKQHPTKKMRPLASGAIQPKQALILATSLLTLALLGSYLLQLHTVLLVYITYLFINILYSHYLKHIAILDVATIATGFVLRVLCGGLVGDIDTSKWLLFMTFLLAIFLGLAKRRDDLVLISEKENTIRKSLDGYSIPFVNQAMSLMSSVLVVCYILYLNTPEVESRFGSIINISFFPVVIGILRYLQITIVEQNSGSPTNVLWKDVFLQICIAMWISIFLVCIYFL